MLLNLKDVIKPRSAPRIRYRCPSCSRKHSGFPALAYAMPDAIFELTPEARPTRTMVSSDLCSIDDERYFVRCTLSVPVHGLGETFEYGPWVEVTAQDFARYAIHFNMGADPGWTWIKGRLANAFPHSARPTLDVACRVRLAGTPGQRPSIEITDVNAPLFAEQRLGIPISRAMELVESMRGFVLLVD